MKASMLIGLAVEEAKARAEAGGLIVHALPKGSARIALAVANTLFLSIEDGKVCSVEAGDPTEVEV